MKAGAFFADLLRLAPEHGILPLPQCPGCRRQIALDQWDIHAAYCPEVLAREAAERASGAEKQTPPG